MSTPPPTPFSVSPERRFPRGQEAFVHQGHHTGEGGGRGGRAPDLLHPAVDHHHEVVPHRRYVREPSVMVFSVSRVFDVSLLVSSLERTEVRPMATNPGFCYTFVDVNTCGPASFCVHSCVAAHVSCMITFGTQRATETVTLGLSLPCLGADLRVDSWFVFSTT